jgi:hypothetical protein
MMQRNADSFEPKEPAGADNAPGLMPDVVPGSGLGSTLSAPTSISRVDLSAEGVLKLQRSAGNRAAQLAIRQQRVGIAGLGRQATLQRAIAMSRPSPSVPGQADYAAIVKRYRDLLASGDIAAEDKAEADAAMGHASSALRRHQEVESGGSTSASIAAGALGATAVLAADDVTGIGIADDVAIPFTLLAAAVFGMAALALAPGAQERARSLEAAQRAVVDAIEAIGTIVMAADVGKQIRSDTENLAIHLARLLGVAVAGMPPDHQGDPPGRNDNHWWTEIKNFVNSIVRRELTPKQLWRELSKKFTAEQIKDIMDALRRAAEKMGGDGPNFPPVAFP